MLTPVTIIALTGPITSVGNVTSIVSQTGTGTTFAMSAGPSFTGNVFLGVGASGAGNLSLSFTGDTNTGLYRSAADEMRLQTGGVDAVTVDASQNATFAGNVTVGATGAQKILTVDGYEIIKSAGTIYGYLIKSGTWGDVTYTTDFAIAAVSAALRFYAGSGVTPGLTVQNAYTQFPYAIVSPGGVNKGFLGNVGTWEGNSNSGLALVGYVAGADVRIYTNGGATASVVVSTAGNATFTGSVAIGSGTPITKVISATATLDFGNTSAQTSTDLTITVTGAAVGDSVDITPPASPDANTSFSGWVSAADTCTVRFNNYSSGSVNPASGTFRATVFKF